MSSISSTLCLLLPSTARARFLRVNFVDENMGRLPVPLSRSLRERYGMVLRLLQ